MARPKSGKPPAIVLPVRVPPADRSTLQQIADARGITVSDLARESLRRTIEEHQQELVAS